MHISGSIWDRKCTISPPPLCFDQSQGCIHPLQSTAPSWRVLIPSTKWMIANLCMHAPTHFCSHIHVSLVCVPLSIPDLAAVVHASWSQKVSTPMPAATPHWRQRAECTHATWFKKQWLCDRYEEAFNLLVSCIQLLSFPGSPPLHAVQRTNHWGKSQSAKLHSH